MVIAGLLRFFWKNKVKKTGLLPSIVIK